LHIETLQEGWHVGIGRLAIAVLLLWSGAAKLLDLSATREAALALGLPRRIARFVGTFLPVAEISLAVALLVRPVALAAMVGAAGLFAAFTALVVVNLANGRRPACHCFGAAHSEPIGATTAMRNVALTGSSIALIATHATAWGPDPLRWLGARGPTAVVLAIMLAVIGAALAVESALLVASLRRHGRLLLRVDALEAALGMPHVAMPTTTHVLADHAVEVGLPVGTAAPEFVLTALNGEVVSLTALLVSGNPLLLVFADASCGPCHALLPTVAAWQRDPHTRATVAVIASGDKDIVRAAAAEHQLDSVLHEASPTIAAAFKFQGTPCAVVVDIDGTIAAPMASGADAIKALAAKYSSVPVVLGRREPSAAELGAAAPTFRLPRIDGGELALDDLRGHEVVVLFWDPSCGFCQQLAPDLRSLERRAPDNTPIVVLISSGTAEDNREFGLASPILIDSSRELMRAYGASGTPIAVLVDEDGNIASAPAVGGRAVLDLVRNARTANEQPEPNEQPEQNEESLP
jgi:peroxiredoxin/uncharacterized membrane protein YphA (DoxX/SURF4 family)